MKYIYVLTINYNFLIKLLCLQIVEEDSFEDYIPEEDLALEDEYLHPTTAEKETNTECNFCPEGARQLHRRYASIWATFYYIWGGFNIPVSWQIVV